MAEVVDYTGTAALTKFASVAPGWDKIRVDFTKKHLAAADWAKIAVIPAHTYVFEVATYIVVPAAAASAFCVGDVSADGSVTWVASQDADTADVVAITLVADTNGATRGKYYHSAGALYVSATPEMDTLVVDIYVHAQYLGGV
jgi:hypothetical protein